MRAPTNPRQNILLLSGGSKVAIARIAKAAALKRGVTLHISDTTDQVPCKSIADHFWTLPLHDDPNWGNALEQLCETANIALVIPTRHSELLALSAITPRLERSQTKVCISSEETLRLCIQKFDTYHFLKSINVPTSPSCLKASFSNQLNFPIIAKPERGHASTGIKTVTDSRELSNVPNDWILQEKAFGLEYTINTYISKTGEVICAIPHQRIAVESGEVVQAKTRKIRPLIDVAETIATKLPGAAGIINIQAFLDKATGAISIIEINPRIGGGYPLCDAAKGHYIEWLCQEYLDRNELKPFHAWTDNLLMMRYREGLFSL